VWVGHSVFGAADAEVLGEVWNQIVAAIQSGGFRALCRSMDRQMPFKLATIMVRMRAPPFEMVLPILQAISDASVVPSLSVLVPFVFVLIRAYPRADLIEFVLPLLWDRQLDGIEAVFPEEIAADFCAILAEVPVFVEALRGHPVFGKALFEKFQILSPSDELTAAQLAIFPPVNSSG
jgi:hypothetical protein